MRQGPESLRAPFRSVSLPPSSLSTMAPRESHPALAYQCFLFPQLSPLSPHLWPHRDCFLKPPAGDSADPGKPSGRGCSCRPVLGLQPASPAPRQPCAQELSAAVVGDSYTPGADRLRIKTLTFSAPPPAPLLPYNLIFCSASLKLPTSQLCPVAGLEAPAG